MEAAQQLINAAREAKPNAVLVIYLSGNLIVENTPLRLGSRMCLVLGNRASITATADTASASHAQSLVQIDSGEFVSISSSGSERGVLDGQHRALAGVAVSGCGKVNIDNLSIRGCGVAAISYTGRNATAVNDSGSVTRCLIADCGNGLVVAKTAGFICLDNDFRNNRGVAITMTSQRSIIAGNDLIRNNTGVISACDHGMLPRNTFEQNETTLKLETTSVGNLVTGNRGRGKTGTVSIGGQNNQLFGNDLMTSVRAIRGGDSNLLINNARLQVDTAVRQLHSFNPPTFNNPHTGKVIVPGMGRFDLAIGGSSNKDQPVDLTVVQDGLQRARDEHSNDVIVLRLQGHYLSHSPAGLQLPSNTCVILDGSIRADLGIAPDPIYNKKDPITQVVRLAPEEYCSFSGGTLDGGRQAFHAINATNESIVLIDGVNLKGSVRDGIHTKGRGLKCPLFINGCSVFDNGGRGIWMHVAGGVHALGNVCVGNNMDGIDVDAYATDCTVLFNVSAGNHRHGVFVEEAVKNNVVFGNNLLGNNQSGIHVWNETVAGNTGQNVIAANRCRGNVKGVTVGGRAADRTASENLFFNDVCLDNRNLNLVSGNSHATNNYFSQFVIDRNAEKQVGVFNKADLFFATPGEQ